MKVQQADPTETEGSSLGLGGVENGDRAVFGKMKRGLQMESSDG